MLRYVVNQSLQWQLWSRKQIVEALPSLLATVESNLHLIPSEYHEKDQSAISALRADPPSVEELRAGRHTRDLVTLALGLDVLARQTGKDGKPDEALELFRSAHELLRAGEPTARPTQFMRQTLWNAARMWARQLFEFVKAGELDAGQVRDKLRSFVISAWGSVPESMELEINEMIFVAVEHIRVALETDRPLQDRLVRNNIESLLSMEIPSRLEVLSQRWEEVGQHIAPAAVRGAQRLLKRPAKLSILLPQDVRDEIDGAVRRGDRGKLANVLAANRDALESNLRLRLDAKPEYREPNAAMRFRGGPDRFFDEAKELLMRGDPRALEKFRNIHFNKSTNTYAKEWYAYALTRFGEEGDRWDVIDLLEETVASQLFRSDMQWTARWNLACALSRVPDRADEALGVLYPVLQSDTHTTEVFELCLLWALGQDREDLLQKLLSKAVFYEAHLLAALLAAEEPEDTADARAFRPHLQRLNHILKDIDRTFPDPKDEGLAPTELHRLAKEFIDFSLEDAGAEWFRQRVAYGSQAWNAPNWECAAQLYERIGDKDATLLCYQQKWRCVRAWKRNADIRLRMFFDTLEWTMRNGYREEGARLLKQDWKLAGLTESAMLLWDERLRGATPSKPALSSSESITPGRQVPPPAVRIEDSDRLIQELAPRFVQVTDIRSLAKQADDARRLIAAAKAKRPEIGDELAGFLTACLEFITRFDSGVNEEEAEQLAQRLSTSHTQLKEQRQRIPYELNSLAQAIERVAQNVLVRVRSGSHLAITPPHQLRMTIGAPPQGEHVMTTLLARISNDTQEPVKHLDIAFFTPSRSLKFPNQLVQIDQLESQQTAVVECRAEVAADIEDAVDVTVHLTGEVSGVTRTFEKGGRVSINRTWAPVPASVRYVTTAPVGTERIDLFHGRDRELADLALAFSDGRLRTLYFVNGIRRVGKSTVMKHLGPRCGPTILSFLLNIEEALSGQKMNSAQLVRQLMRACLQQLRQSHASLSVPLPDASAFEIDPPWVVFEDFLRSIQSKTQVANILICFDELPVLVKAIADTSDPMDDGCLAWIRSKAQEQSEILLICTGSEPYEIMRSRYRQHTVWGNLMKYDVSFVDRAAMEKIVTSPVLRDRITWMPEALQRMWTLTEGHPWITQLLASEACSQLNREMRRLVGPEDVSRAADSVSTPLVTELWWNETRDGLLTSTHRQIAFLILQQQELPGCGLSEAQAFELCQRSGIRNPGRYLEEMKLLEVVTEFRVGADPYWRIRGGFLEKYLTTLMHHTMQDSDSRKARVTAGQPVALMLDCENIKIRMTELSKEMPEERAKTLRARLKGDDLAIRLLRSASRHGEPRQKWAVADWDRPIFEGDQKAFRAAGYRTDISGQQKVNASDHVLKEHIHFVLREHPQIDTFIIATGDGDFNETIETLKDKDKRVVLWASRQAINSVYGAYLRRPDAITIEWLEDLLEREMDVAMSPS